LKVELLPAVFASIDRSLTDVNIVKSGDYSITKTIAYSIDGIKFSSFSADFPTEGYRYWMVKVDVIAETKVEIYKIELITGES